MKVSKNIQKTALVAAVTLAISGIATVDNNLNLQVDFSSVISAAYAGDSDGGSGGHKGAMGANKGGQGERGQGSQGYKGGKSAADVLADDDGDDESDRPQWAQSPGRDGKPGGGSAGSDNQKGGDYGDLVELLRNDLGQLVDPDGNLIPPGGDAYLVDVNGDPIQLVDGEVPAGAQPIPIETGRLNIVRAPASVIEHSLVEVLSKLDQDGAVIGTDASGRLTVTVDGVTSTIDSPVENLAIYQALLEADIVDGKITLTATSSHDGDTTTYSVSFDPEDRLDLAASALAAASDKTGTLTVGEIVFTSETLGVFDELSSLVSVYEYDRDTTYNFTVNVLVLQPDGTYKEQPVDLLSTDIWTDYSTPAITIVAPDNADADGIDIFTQAADDSVQVLEFVHEYEAP